MKTRGTGLMERWLHIMISVYEEVRRRSNTESLAFFYVYVILNSFDDFIIGPFGDYFGSTALEKCENELSVNLFYWVVYVV